MEGIAMNFEYLSKPTPFSPRWLQLFLGLQPMTRGAYNKEKTHCRNGHPYSEENTYLNTTQRKGSRHCRRCDADRKLAKRGVFR